MGAERDDERIGGRRLVLADVGHERRAADAVVTRAAGRGRDALAVGGGVRLVGGLIIAHSAYVCKAREGGRGGQRAAAVQYNIVDMIV